MRKIIRKLPEDFRSKIGRIIDEYYFIFFPIISLLYNVLVIPLPRGRVILYGHKLKILGYKKSWFIFNEIVNNKIYERFYTFKKGDVVIDVGANIGIFSVSVAGKVGSNGCVIAVEPEPNTFHLLSMNSSRYGNIIPIPKALGNRIGLLKLFISQSNPGGHSFKKVEYEDRFTLVEVTTLDKLVEDVRINKVDFIKIDTEGFELEVLEGTKKTLTTFYPHLALEYHSKKDKKAIIAYLSSVGYNEIKIMEIDNDLGYIYAWREQ